MAADLALRSGMSASLRSSQHGENPKQVDFLISQIDDIRVSACRNTCNCQSKTISLEDLV